MNEVLSDREAEIFYAEQRGYASAMEAERKLHEAHIKAQAAEIEMLLGDLAKAVGMLDKTRLVLAEWEPHPFPVLAQVRATLAELTGDKT